MLMPLPSIASGTVDSSFQTDAVSEIHLNDSGKVGDGTWLLQHHTILHYQCVAGT
jgi:hypothetical protein